MSTVIGSAAVFPLASYPNGNFSSSPVDVPDAATMLEFSLQRCTDATPTIWPNTSTLLSFELFVSLDGGQTWQEAGGANGIAGGIKTVKGVQIASDVFDSQLPPGTGRKMKATGNISGGPLRSQGSVNWLA